MQRSLRKKLKLRHLSIKSQRRRSSISPLQLRPNQLRQFMSHSLSHSLLEMLSRSILLQIISHQLKRTPLKEDMPLCFSLQPPSKNLSTPSMRTSSTSNPFMITLSHSSSSPKTQELALKKLLLSIQLWVVLVISILSLLSSWRC